MSNFRLSSVVQKIIFLVKCVIGWCVLVPVLLVLLPFCIWKTVVIFLARAIHPSFRRVPVFESLYVVDNVAKKADKERNALGNALVCVELDTSSGDEIDLKQFVQKLEEAVLQNKDLKNYIWKLKSYLIQFCGYTFWAEAPNFCILNHVSKVELPPNQNITEYMNHWKAMPFESPKSPLWEVRILKHNSKEQIVFKFHHSVLDGLSVADILGMVFQDKIPDKPRMISRSAEPSLLDKVSLLIKIPSLLFEISRLMKAQDALRFDSGTEMAQMTSSQTLNLSELKGIAKKYGVRLQTVLLTIQAGVLQRFIEKTGRTTPDYTVLCLPQPRPNRPSNFIGNHSNVINVRVSMTLKDPQQRLAQVETEIEKIYSTNMNFVNEILMGFASILPYMLCKYFIKRASSPVRCTISPLRVLGPLDYKSRVVTGIRLHLGLTTPQTGAMSLLLSYQDELTWSLTGAKNLFQTQEQLDLLTGQFLTQEIAEFTTSGTTNSTRKLSHCEITMES